MTYKKTWFGWLTFFLSAGLMSVLLFSFFTLLYSLVVKVSFITDYSYLFSAFSVLILYGFFFLLNFIKSRFSLGNSRGFKIFSYIFSGLLFLGITGFGLYLALTDVNAFLSQSRVFDSNDSYIAIIDAMIYKNPVPHCNTLNFIYCAVVSIIFRIFGVNLAYAGIFEICLFIAGSVLLFVSILKLYGKTPALFGYAFTFVLYRLISPDFMKGMDSFILLYFISAFIAFIFSLIVKARYNGEMKGNANCILFILIGALYGLLIYLDLSMIFLFAGGIVILCSAENDNSNIKKAINRKPLPALCFTLSGIFISCGSFLLDTLLSGESVKEQIFLLGSKFYLINVINVLLPTDYLNECIVILSFCLFASLSFLTSQKNDRYGSVFISYIVFVLLSAFSLINVNVSMISIVFYGLMVGCGIQELLFRNYREEGISAFGEVILLDEEGSNTDTSEVENPSDPVSNISTDTTSEGGLGEAPAETSSETSGEVYGNVSGDNSTDVTGNDSGEGDGEGVLTVHVLLNEEPAEATAQNVAFDKTAMIDNPLPLPKKHVKKRIDFPLEPSEDMMKFDIQIKDDDDFDV